MVRQLEAVYKAGVLRPSEPLPLQDNQRVLVTVTDELPPTSRVNQREKEMLWIKDHGRGYAGQWVALEGERLLAHGEKLKSVLQASHAQGVELPLVVHFSAEPELPFGGW